MEILDTDLSKYEVVVKLTKTEYNKIYAILIYSESNLRYIKSIDKKGDDIYKFYFQNMVQTDLGKFIEYFFRYLLSDYNEEGFKQILVEQRLLKINKLKNRINENIKS